MDRDDLLQAVLAQRVVGVGLRPHGAGPVEGADGGDVLEVVGLHQAQQGAHATAVELENAQSLPAREQLIGGAVVKLDVVDVQGGFAVGDDVVQGVGDDREVAQPQEVHLEQPQVLAGGVVELGDDGAVLETLHHGDDVGQRG